MKVPITGGTTAFWGTQATSPTGINDFRSSGASGFAAEIIKNHSARWEFLPYAAPPGSVSEYRITEVEYFNGATQGRGAGGTNYSNIPVSANRARVVIAQFARNIDVYFNGIHYLRFTMTATQALAGTGGRFGILGESGSAPTKTAYLYSMYVASQDIELSIPDFEIQGGIDITRIVGLGSSATEDTGTSSGDIAVLGTGGRFATARLGSGTANEDKVLYGDSTWKDEPGGRMRVAGHVFVDNVTVNGSAFISHASFQLTLPTGTSGNVMVFADTGNASHRISGRLQIGTTVSNTVQISGPFHSNPNSGLSMNHLFTGLSAGAHTIALHLKESIDGACSVNDINLSAMEI